MRNAAFTLVELMIVVNIIGLLAAVAIPSFIVARGESQAKACINNLRQIAAGKEQASATLCWTNGMLIEGVMETQIWSWVKNGSNTVCPARGTYTLNAIGVDPTCSKGTNGHTL